MNRLDREKDRETEGFNFLSVGNWEQMEHRVKETPKLDPMIDAI